MSHSILVVDDEEIVRNSFPLALEEGGYNICTVASGKQAIEELKNKKYDLVYLDLNMPDLNGIETFREIRKFDQETKIYFITAFHERFTNDLKELSENEQTYELLKKPIDMHEIQLLTGNILEK